MKGENKAIGQHRALVQVQADLQEGERLFAFTSRWSSIANKSRHPHPFRDNKAVEGRQPGVVDAFTRGFGVERRPLIAAIEARSENPWCPSWTPRVHCEGVGPESGRTVFAS